jgi:predicted pyridoxine 5'-phosphate oxidase superfamily flavin-nucleotide-binding protein
MRLAWERPGVVQMTVKVGELAALIAGARVAARALAAQPSETIGELNRILDEFERASRGLKRTQPNEPGATDWFEPGSRTLQGRFGTRDLADRITDKFLKDRLDANDRAFVERADMMFVATADGEGRPTCSHKGGDPGFVTVIDGATIAFPSYDGNGMYLSWGNVLANPEVGLLFIDLERGHRLRIHGTATIDGTDELLASYPGAQFIVRVAIRDVFPNCPRYIHRYRLVERSTYVPSAGHEPPVPDWKKEAWAADVLPTQDPPQLSTQGDRHGS